MLLMLSVILCFIYLNMDPKKVSLFFISLVLSLININLMTNINWLMYFIILLFLSGIFVILLYISSLSSMIFLKLNKSLLIFLLLITLMKTLNYFNINLMNFYVYPILIIIFLSYFLYLMILLNFLLNFKGSMRKF